MRERTQAHWNLRKRSLFTCASHCAKLHRCKTEPPRGLHPRQTERGRSAGDRWPGMLSSREEGPQSREALEQALCLLWG